MRKIRQWFLAPLLLGFACNAAFAVDVPARKVPAPDTVSPEVKEIITGGLFPFWNSTYKNADEWKAWVKLMAEGAEKSVPVLMEKYDVAVEAGIMGGAKVYTVNPKKAVGSKKDRVLLYFHDGGYILNPGLAGTTDAIVTAAKTGIKVISVDYRTPPDFPFPAAMDDALAVYKELLKTYPASKIGVLGVSSGGGMALALVHMAKDAQLPVPGALAPATAWADLTKTGDSYFTNEYVDTLLVSYDGWLAEAAKLYAGEQDMKHPYLSPVYGDAKDFPPTLLVSGTRDLFLSNTVRMHRKLRDAGVFADLVIFEGVGHGQFRMRDDSPEAKTYYKELGQFFDRYLK